MQQSLSPAGKERLKVLDVIRGVTMILVVFHHVRGVTFGLYGSPSPLSEFFVAFRMPMFFFISGFVAYKAVDSWNMGLFRRRLGKKAMVELVPTVVFFSLFVALEGWDWTFPGGYWFTLALFGMLAAYYAVSTLCHYACPRARMTVLAVVALVLYTLPMAVDMKGITTLYPVEKTCSFFIFFVFGLAMGSSREKYFRVVSQRHVIAVLMAVSLGILAYQHFHRHLPQPLGLALTFAGSLALMNVVFAAFYTRRDYWHRDGRLSRTLQYVGRRTLDVYMLHWFLLPTIPALRNLMKPSGNNLAVELLVVGGVALLVTAVSIGISTLLRTSPFLAKYLFGVSAPKSAAVDDSVSPSHIMAPLPVAHKRQKARIVLPAEKVKNIHIHQ